MTGREYALMLLDPVSAERTSRELQAVDHRNVVKMHWLGKLNDGTTWLSTEFIRGRNLREVIWDDSPIPVDQIRSMVGQLLQALLVIHPNEERMDELWTATNLAVEELDELRALQAEGLVHRDIKPENLILEEETGRLVLVDFGLSSRAGTRRITYSHTPGFLPPDVEIQRWEPDIDRFAAGVVIFELISGGVHPYGHAGELAAAGNPFEVRDPRDLRSDVPDDLAEFVITACAPDKEDRFDSTAQMVRAWTTLTWSADDEGTDLEDHSGTSGNGPSPRGDTDLESVIVNLVETHTPIVCKELNKMVRKSIGEQVLNNRLNPIVYRLVREGTRIRQIEPMGGGQLNKTVYAVT